MKNLEIEYKVMIEKKAYDKILNYFANTEKTEIEQTNYYYDTLDNQISKHKMSLRIRNVNNTFIVCLKETQKEGKMEYEYVIKDNNTQHLPPKIVHKLTCNNILVDDLIFKGSLRTLRTEIVYKNCLLCIDHSFYNGIEDYELELETKEDLNHAKVVLSSLLADLNIPYSVTSMSKSARAKKSNQC